MPQKVHALKNDLGEHVARMILTQHDLTIKTLDGQTIVSASWQQVGWSLMTMGTPSPFMGNPPEPNMRII